MLHDTSLITTIVAGLVLAFILGAIANRLRLPPPVGYLLAGILVGPHTFGILANEETGAQLAETGVVLLMFGIGLRFSLGRLARVRPLAIPGAVAQMGAGTLLGLGLGLLMGWEIGGSLIFGLALSVASGVVLLTALRDRRLIETEGGRIALDWLIVEDVVLILALVLIPAFVAIGGVETGIYDPFVSFVERVLRINVGVVGVLALTLVKMAAFIGFMLIVGRRAVPWLLHATAYIGSRELFRLAVLAIALAIALGASALFGVSLALGAFFAGIILSENVLSRRAAEETLPLRDAFSVLFFVSVGMLFDPAIVLSDPLPLLATVFIIVVGKSAAAFAILVMSGRPIPIALTVSASLAQIGEFSFILAWMGMALALMPSDAQNLILAGLLISIVINPLVFRVAEMLRPGLERRAASHAPVSSEPVEPFIGPVVPDAEVAAGDDPVSNNPPKARHTVLVGFGRVGSVIGEGLHSAGVPLTVIDDADGAVAAARAVGIEVIVGNAANSEALERATLEHADTLLVAVPNSFEAGQVTQKSRKLNPDLHIITRAHSEEEARYLADLGADTVVGKTEIGLGMLARIRGEHESAATAAAGAIRRGPGSGMIDDMSTPSAAAVVVPLAGDAEAVVPEAEDSASGTLVDEPVAVPPAMRHEVKSEDEPADETESAAMPTEDAGAFVKIDDPGPDADAASDEDNQPAAGEPDDIAPPDPDDGQGGDRLTDPLNEDETAGVVAEGETSSERPDASHGDEDPPDVAQEVEPASEPADHGGGEANEPESGDEGSISEAGDESGDRPEPGTTEDERDAEDDTSPPTIPPVKPEPKG